MHQLLNILMVTLKPYSSKKSLLPLGSGLLITSFCMLHAEVIPFFNPIEHTTPYKSTFQTKAFIANDPVSLDDFFHDWQGDYSPKKGDNFAVEFLRVDMGIVLKNGYYVGYFYQNDIIIQTNRDFVDAYYAIKNNLTPQNDTLYDLTLGIDGIERHGIVASKTFLDYQSPTQNLKIALGAYLSYDTALQNGTIQGTGTLSSDNTYTLLGESTYFYSENLLYDLDVEESYGLGYGMHLACYYTHTPSHTKVTLLINDLFARSYWKNLPYSLITLQTQNETIGEDGYLSYDPTISGWELTKNYTQIIDPKYHIEVEKSLSSTSSFTLGYDYAYALSMPYIKTSYSLEDTTLSLRYEQRFKSFGCSYTKENWHLSLYTNGLKNTSAFGFSAGLHYQF